MSESIAIYCESLTLEQLHRFHSTLHDRIYRAFAGGTSFGVDWATLWAVYPGFAIALSVVCRAMQDRIHPFPEMAK